MRANGRTSGGRRGRRFGVWALGDQIWVDIGGSVEPSPAQVSPPLPRPGGRVDAVLFHLAAGPPDSAPKASLADWRSSGSSLPFLFLSKRRRSICWSNDSGAAD